MCVVHEVKLSTSPLHSVQLDKQKFIDSITSHTSKSDLQRSDKEHCRPTLQGSSKQ